MTRAAFALLLATFASGCARSAIEPFTDEPLPIEQELDDASVLDDARADARVVAEASVADAALAVDAGPQSDASVLDARVQDASAPDASMPDAPDASSQDAGAPDTGAPVVCEACPFPGESCTTLLGTCGCRLLPILPCGPRPLLL